MVIASIVASIVSIILALVAIALSVFFYTQSKNTESSVGTSLAEIKTQTDALQKLTGRWMDRLTKYVTTPHESMSDAQLNIITAIKNIPKDIVSELKGPVDGGQQFDYTQECIAAYCALYYYTAIANYWAQLSLPPIESFDQENPLHAFTKQAVDSSYQDIRLIARILDKIDPALIQNNKFKHLADKTRAEYLKLVGDSTIVYAKRAEFLAQAKDTPTG